MKPRHRTVAIPTAIISLLNLPVGFTTGTEYLSEAARWAISLLGAIGLVTAAGLFARHERSLIAARLVGILNVVSGALVAVSGQREGLVGVAFGATILALTGWSSVSRTQACPGSVEVGR